MKILVLGCNGMFGHRLCRHLAHRMEVYGSVRGDPSAIRQLSVLPEKSIIGNIEAENLTSLTEVLDAMRPAAVINCIGIVKQRELASDIETSIRVNALFPHQLADICDPRGIRVFQLGTDCVFSGSRGQYMEQEFPDPTDIYGRTKLLGELNRPGCITLRTSFIGWQLGDFNSLLSWFALQRGKRIKGFRRAIYTGLSTSVLAILIEQLLLNQPTLHGLYHVASHPISKYDLLVELRERLGWRDIILEPDDDYICDRSLVAERFGSVAGWQPPSWSSMLDGLASEWPNYSKHYLTA